MLATLLLLFQFAAPQDFASAYQHGGDVVISVTYTTQRPTRVCTERFGPDDPDMQYPLDTPHCWKPSNDVGDFDTYERQSLITIGELRVTLIYPTHNVVMVLNPLDS